MGEKYRETTSILLQGRNLIPYAPKPYGKLKVVWVSPKGNSVREEEEAILSSWKSENNKEDANGACGCLKSALKAETK